MAAKVGKEIKVPRVVGRQLLRLNVKSNSVEEHWQRVVILPFLDCLINQLEECLKGRSNQALKAHFLIPSHLKLINDAYLEDIKAAYECDIPIPSTISQEFRLWTQHWANGKDKLVTVRDILKQLFCHGFSDKLYPSIVIILHSGSVKRSNSALKFVKNA